jgi:hypothetical protein
MKMTLSFFQFIDNWPEGRKDQFSFDALRAIFDEIEQIENDTAIETEFDPIAICCEWTEYDNEIEAAKEYGYEPDSGNDEEKAEDARKWLEDRTTILDAGDKIVMIQF